jgi:hypothetical protein
VSYYLEKNLSQKMTDGVTQGECPEFKPQCHKTTTTKTICYADGIQKKAAVTMRTPRKAYLKSKSVKRDKKI